MNKNIKILRAFIKSVLTVIKESIMIKRNAWETQLQNLSKVSRRNMVKVQKSIVRFKPDMMNDETGKEKGGNRKR